MKNNIGIVIKLLLDYIMCMLQIQTNINEKLWKISNSRELFYFYLKINLNEYTDLTILFT